MKTSAFCVILANNFQKLNSENPPALGNADPDENLITNKNCGITTLNSDCFQTNHEVFTEIRPGVRVCVCAMLVLRVFPLQLGVDICQKHT